MKRRIKSTPSILWVLLLVLSASCSKDEIQIVDQDTSWQMDNKYIEEDIREQLGIDPFTDLVYLGYYGKPYIQLEATNDLYHQLHFRTRWRDNLSDSPAGQYQPKPGEHTSGL